MPHSQEIISKVKIYVKTFHVVLQKTTEVWQPVVYIVTQNHIEIGYKRTFKDAMEFIAGFYRIL